MYEAAIIKFWSYYDQNLIIAASYMEQWENPILENSKLSITWDSILPLEPSLPLQLKVYT